MTTVEIELRKLLKRYGVKHEFRFYHNGNKSYFECSCKERRPAVDSNHAQDLWLDHVARFKLEAEQATRALLALGLEIQ